ncbi:MULTISPECIES: hypothetical protein [unclassified Clostridium]|uniref:hypothetical protein n=1 Tax=unclassified Clostridium TaxID=2614128 RepID=UPI0002985073|nr:MULTISPECIES: hypothetical protein [unclassified Clostridium]EKQ52395.1 MAG: hypothetical protein A370_04228 [Clostridium sp. Maddingley MBC34-26]
MIKIERSENGELHFIGEFNLGALGKYTDEIIEFNVDNFAPLTNELDFDSDDTESMYYKNRFSRLEKIISLEMNEDEKLEKLAEFYEEKQKEVIEHLGMIEDRFLKYILQDFVDCDFPFWEEADGSITSFIIPEKMPNLLINDEDEIIKMVYGNIPNNIYELIDPDYEPDKSVISAKEICLKYFPMIDVDKLISTIYPDIIVLNGDILIFQCSSNVGDGMIICSAYDEILPNYKFDDWHNH